MYAQIIIEYPVKSLDKMFTYEVPLEMRSKIKVGMKVLVPFGKNEINGFILKIAHNFCDDYEVKKITEIVDEDIVLTDELLRLGRFMSDKTLCTMISAYQAMFPSSFKIKNKKSNYEVFDVFLVLNISDEEAREFIAFNSRAKKQVELVLSLLECGKVLKKVFDYAVVKALLSKNIIKEEKVQKYRDVSKITLDKNIVLTDLQMEVYKSVELNVFNTYLLYGITGSGKTEVYLNLIEDVIKSGRTAIMLVSEISLTMQIVKRFYARFGKSVAVFHSALSEGEKHDEYLRVIRGEVSVVVGTRSAIFTPLKNLGIVIIDEEHSDTYKQDNNPRYNAKDMALFRCKENGCPLVLGSATPTLDSMARAAKGVYKLLVLDKRVGSATLPITTLVDMNLEVKKHNYIFSDVLREKINETLERGEQVILLLNRRGFSTFINCSSCGHTYKCPNCDITLTYHKTKNNLVCHYCGHFKKKDDLCPECKEDSLNYLGLGTEKLEDYINENFVGAKVVRMDQDTTTKKGSHDRIIESFKNKEFNILLGTQMISKGLDFEDVTLVGVINADASLNIPDYKANESTFALLNQVAGRSGRSNKKGEVLLQTFNPDNYILKCVRENDYKSFYKYEMQFRQKLKYPPYYFLIGIRFVSKEFNLALEEAKKGVAFIKRGVGDGTSVLGPTTAAILKHNNSYRFQVIIKYKKDEKLFETLKELDKMYATNNKVSVEIDVSPNRI